MAQWKKVIVSGSIAELQIVSASNAVVVGASGYNIIGTNQSNTVLSGSFTGSFSGDGSALTGLVSTLNISGSDASTGTVSLKTQNLTITGDANEIDTRVSGQTVTIGLVSNPIITGTLQIGGNVIKNSASASVITLNGTDAEIAGNIKVGGNDIKASDGSTNITLTSNTLTTIAGDIKVSGNTISSSTATAIELNGSDVEVRGDLQVTGNDIKSSAGTSVITLNGADATINGTLTVQNDLFVQGNTTYLNVSQLAIEDKFILLSSGSVAAGDAGLVVDFGGGSGSVFAYDSATSRWGLTGSFNATGSAYTPDAYVASVVTTDIPAYQQVGNIRIQSGEIYIYV